MITKKLRFMMLFVAVWIACFAGQTYSEEIENVEISLDRTGRGVNVYYNLIDDNPEAMFEVILHVSDDGGETFSVKPRTVSGDIGLGISPGRRKRIHWKALEDFPEFISTEAAFEVESRRLSAREIRKIPGRISVKGFPEGALVYVDGRKVGGTPLHNNRVPLGKRSIRVRSMGYEIHRENVIVDRGGTAEISYELTPKKKGKAFLKSLLFPGRGQWYAEHKGKGVLFTLLQAGTVAGSVLATKQSMDAMDKYDDARTAYRNALNERTADYYHDYMEKKYDDASQAYTIQMAAMGAALGVYLWNVIDAALTEPKREVELRRGSVNISPRLRGEGSGISLSVRF